MWVCSMGENNKDFHVVHSHEVRERPWRRNTGRPFPVIPSSRSNILGGVIRRYRPSGQYERWALWVIVADCQGKSPPRPPPMRRDGSLRFPRSSLHSAGGRSIDNAFWSFLESRFAPIKSIAVMPRCRAAKKPRSRSGSRRGANRHRRRLVRASRDFRISS